MDLFELVAECIVELPMYYPSPHKLHQASGKNPMQEKINLEISSYYVQKFTSALVPGLFLRKIVAPSAIFIFDIKISVNVQENDRVKVFGNLL